MTTTDTGYTVIVYVQVDNPAHARLVIAAMEEAAAKLDGALVGYGCDTDDGDDVPMDDARSDEDRAAYARRVQDAAVDRAFPRR